ncbi:long-chain-fatty-acid--CoA ligase [Candidatus Termititenax persephonae]|uniref:Long-chain-fatty-acid--CoA ligase n=1 Tax=Candidatus Termititenax persephonae TaxID=2218525 RepID=A0A388TFN3_9BACT|nr:long-chain-fatty-acid--CoA ligase [Candidatus Termititenax persephonae]
MTNQPRNLYEAFAATVSSKADALLFDNKYSYRQVWQMVQNRALFLQGQGIQRGDCVGILSGNSWEWCATHMAIVSLGAVALHLDQNLDAPEIWQRMLERVAAKALFVSKDFAKLDFKNTRILDIHAGWTDSPADLPPPSVTLQDTASYLFTSGTTGEPKIVQLTHGNLYYTATGLIKFLRDDLRVMSGGERFLAILPLHHSYGLLANYLGPLLYGASIVFQPSLKGPDIIKSLAETPIHIFCGVPQLWELFFDGIVAKVKAQSVLKYFLFMAILNTAGVWRKVPGLRTLLAKVFEPVRQVIGREMKFFISGGAALKPRYFKYYAGLGFKIIEGYGLTETSGPACLSNLLHNTLGAVGGPIDGNEVTLRKVNRDGVGEIWLRGVSVTPGYYNNPQANAEAFDQDGWFNTGDLGYKDKHGELHITGRFKNMIVLASGENVYPEELEAYYQGSPLLEEIAVFGYRLDGAESVFAVIVPREKNRDSYRRIRAEIEKMNKGLPSYKTLSDFAVSFAPLPRNSTKKIVIRRVLQELAQGKYQRGEGQDTVRSPYQPTDPRQKEVLKILAEKLGTKVFYQDHTLLELKIDSLKLLDLAAYLELRLNIALDLGKISSLQNLREIVECAAACSRAEQPTDDLVSGRITHQLRPSRNLWVAFLIKLGGGFLCRRKPLTVRNAELYRTANCIYAANHQSYLDIVWLLATMPPDIRQKTYMLGKKELAFLPWLLGRLPIIFVERQGQALSSLKAGADILRQGGSLIVFPEGTRSRDGKLGEFKIGAALLAHKLGKKIVPITIKGAYEIYPRHQRFPDWRSTTQGEVILNPPLDPRDFSTAEELNIKLRDVIGAA